MSWAERGTLCITPYRCLALFTGTRVGGILCSHASMEHTCIHMECNIFLYTHDCVRYLLCWTCEVIRWCELAVQFVANGGWWPYILHRMRMALLSIVRVWEGEHAHEWSTKEEYVCNLALHMTCCVRHCTHVWDFCVCVRECMQHEEAKNVMLLHEPMNFRGCMCECAWWRASANTAAQTYIYVHNSYDAAIQNRCAETIISVPMHTDSAQSTLYIYIYIYVWCNKIYQN